MIGVQIMSTFNIYNACFFTGHRAIAKNLQKDIYNALKNHCIDLINNYNVTDFISGGALGFDTMAAQAIIELKQQYEHIKLHLYLPCTNQAERWNTYDKKMWDSIKLLADDYIYITDMPYVSGCMQLRNKAMVNDAQYCIAYCTRKFGGTASTLKYAQDNERTVINIAKTE